MSDPKNMALLLTRLMHIGPVEVQLLYSSRYAYSNDKVKWTCYIDHRSKDGTELKVSAEDHMPDTAVQQAFEKFFRVAKTGLPEGALSPPIEAKAEEQA